MACPFEEQGVYSLGPSAIRPTPAKAFGLIPKVDEHLLFLLTSAHSAKAQQELNNSECQIDCVTS